VGSERDQILRNAAEEVDQLRRERDQLREALREIQSTLPFAIVQLHKIRTIANRALGDTDHEQERLEIQTALLFQRDRALRQRDEAWEALRRYGQHEQGCGQGWCVCGLSAALGDTEQ
jgi:hypothetical protein